MPGLMAIYRCMIRLYPAGFRSEYGLLLERQLRDELSDAETVWQRVWIWLQAAAETLTNVPLQYGQELAQDLRHSVRVHARRPLPTFLAILTLALAMGAGSAVFSVVSAMLLRPLPFREPSRLVWSFYNTGDASRAQFAAAIKNSPYASEGALFSNQEANIIVPGASLRTEVAFTSAGFFRVLGTRMEVGRGLLDEDDVPGDRAVISHALWQQLYSGDPNVIGSDLRVNRWSYRIVGVAPPEFDYPHRAQVWLGAIFTPRLQDASGALFVETVQRLKPGVSFETARAAYDAVANPHLREDPSSQLPFDRLEDRLTSSREGMGLLLASIGFLILIACANVAHMVLARVLERRKEIEIRAALGAQAGRLMQQLLSESVALALASGLAGLLFALGIVRVLRVFVPPATAAQTYTLLDWRVLAFALAMAVLTGLIFGIAPAWQAMRLRGGIAGRSRLRLRQVLISAQAALTLTLLAAALSMMIGFVRLRGVDLGFQTRNVATLSVSLPGSKAQSPGYYQAALVRLRSVAGVEAASAINYLPLSSIPIFILNYSAQAANIGAMPALVAPDYFRAVGTTLLAGREFTDSDTANSERVVVVNEAFARELTKSDPATAVGRQIRGGNRELRIVGVVRGSLYWGRKQVHAIRQVYTPLAQGDWPNVTFVVKLSQVRSGDLSRLKAALQSVEPTVAIYDVKWFADRLNESFGKDIFYTVAGLALAGCALIFAIAGIYGMAAHAVAQQFHEMAIRAALGARPGGLRVRVCLRTLLFIGVGAAVGAALAQAGGSLILHWMDHAEPIGLRLIVVAALFLVAAAAPALWLATGAIRRMDTSQLLRAE
jgi:predicted permease